MRVFAYSVRKDEEEFFLHYGKELGMEIAMTSETPGLDNVDLAKGFDTINVITTLFSDELVDAFANIGVRFIETRTVGFDHLPLDAIRRNKMGAGHVTYSTDSVADYAIMLMMMSLRKIKTAVKRADAQDFTLMGLRGRGLKGLTVGVVGTGNIGKAVIRRLQGFESRILAYDLYPSKSIDTMATYVPLQTLIAESDVITLHLPGIDGGHLIGAKEFQNMKPTSILINTARASLVDYEALIKALEEKQIAGAAVDVVPDESSIFYFDHRFDVIDNRIYSHLKSMPNAIVLPHLAFYTDHAVEDMVKNSLLSIQNFYSNNENPWKIL